MKVDSENWYFSPYDGPLCKVIESQNLWGTRFAASWIFAASAYRPGHPGMSSEPRMNTNEH